VNPQNYSLSDVIFLLGAGASVDAGLPTIKELTKCLRERFASHKDREFIEIYELLAKADSSIEINYEKFFEYFELIRLSSNRDLFCIRIPDYLLKVINNPFSTDIIRTLMSDILRNYQENAQPEYLSSIADFIPQSKRLKVFTLNYDLCVEIACKNNNISLSTGFDGNWKPDLFNVLQKGINLYKLHGSLNWFIDDKWNVRELTEIPKDQNPELVLGPGSKIQADDPFLTLFNEFHKAVQEAKVCVVIGYGYQDAHINTVLERAGVLKIINVNVEHADILNKKPILISGTAKEVFEKGLITTKLGEILH
jgi:NAD-dependent SIR2 family protein deacetylase